MVVSTCHVEKYDGVMRSFVLNITNLEDRYFDYLLTFVVTPRSVGLVDTFVGSPPPAHEVTQFVNCWLRGAGPWRFEPFRRTGATYTAAMYFRVKARQTVRVVLSPTLIDKTVRMLDGYVTLRLPATRTERRAFTKQPQSDRPVTVLLNPETSHSGYTPEQTLDIYDDPPPIYWMGRQVYDPPPFKRGYTKLQAETFHHTEPLHLASGQAQNELMPEGSRTLTSGDLRYAEEAVKGDDNEAMEYQGAELVADQDRGGALIELLCELEDDALADVLNKILESQKAAIRICKP